MKLLFDTRPLLKFFAGAEGADEVEQLLLAIKGGLAEGFVSVVTLTEIFYIVARADADRAEERVEFVRSSLGVIPVDDAIAVEAGRLESRHGVPLADVLIAATSASIGSMIVSDDKDFRTIGAVALDEREAVKAIHAS